MIWWLSQHILCIQKIFDVRSSTENRDVCLFLLAASKNLSVVYLFHYLRSVLFYGCLWALKIMILYRNTDKIERLRSVGLTSSL